LGITVLVSVAISGTICIERAKKICLIDYA